MDRLITAPNVRHPHIRGFLPEMHREARARPGDPLAARAEVTGGPESGGPRGRRHRTRSV
jgi:nitrate reductase alpha subunit